MKPEKISERKLVRVRPRIPTEGPNPITSRTSQQALRRKENPRDRGARITNRKRRISRIIQFARSVAKLILENAKRGIQMCVINARRRDIMLDSVPTHPIMEMSGHQPKIWRLKLIQCKPNWMGLRSVKVGLKHRNLRRRSMLI